MTGRSRDVPSARATKTSGQTLLEYRRPLAGVRRISTAALLVLALAGFYCSNLRLIAAGDSLPTALTSLSLVVDHSLTLDRFAPWLEANVPSSRGLVINGGGNYYSVYPAGQSVLAAPLIAPAALLFRVKDWETPRQVYFARMLEKLAAATMTSITVLVVFLTLRLVSPKAWSWGLAVVFALGTMAWPIASQALWQQTGGQLCISAAFYSFARWLQRQDSLIGLLASGLCCAAAIFVRPTNVLAAGAIMFPILLWNRKPRVLGAFLVFPILATSVVGPK